MKRSTLIKIIMAVFASLAVLFALTLLLPMVSRLIIGSDNSQTDAESDYLDISNDVAYLAFDRNIYYNEYGFEAPVDPADPAALGKASAFFYKYFNALISGDGQAYRACFDKNYLAKNEVAGEFLPQRLYDISATLYSRTADGGKSVDIFTVRFKIYKNDGAVFDCESNKTYTTVFKLSSVDGETVITDVLEYKVG